MARRTGRGIPELLTFALVAAPSAAWAADDAAFGLGELALRAAGSLAAVIALIVVLALLLRRLKSVPGGLGTGGRITSVARLDLGSRRELRLVRIDGRTLLLGVGGERIELLCELPPEARPDAEPSAGPLRILRELATSS